MLTTIKVIFKDPRYNYLTDINANAPHETVKDYFINTSFDMGCYPVEDLQVCIDIEFID